MASLIECTAHEYHARPSLSRSQFDDYVKYGPEYFRDRHITHVGVREVTPAMKRGTMLHAIVLEGKTVADLADVWRDEVKAGTKNTTAWKTAKQVAYDCGKELITSEEESHLHMTVLHILGEPAATSLFKQCPKREVSFEWTDEATGLELRARADAMGDGIIADLKITELTLSNEAIAKQFSLRGGNYAMQAAWYRRGAKALTGKDHEFWFVFANPEPPYTVAVARPSDDWLLPADIDLGIRLADFAERKRTNNWNRTGYGQMAVIERPNYDKFTMEYE